MARKRVPIGSSIPPNLKKELRRKVRRLLQTWVKVGGPLHRYPEFREIRNGLPPGIPLSRYMGTDFIKAKRKKAVHDLIDHAFREGSSAIESHPSYEFLSRRLQGAPVYENLLSHAPYLKHADQMIGLIPDFQKAMGVVTYIEKKLGILQATRNRDYIGDLPSYIRVSQTPQSIFDTPEEIDKRRENLIANARKFGAAVQEKFGIQLEIDKNGNVGHRITDPNKAELLRMEGKREVPWSIRKGMIGAFGRSTR